MGTTWGPRMALMITMSRLAAAAKKYFAERLRQSDYLSEGGARPGIWFGKGAERLGLSGEVAAKDFAALADNKDPRTGKRLTVRDVANARPGYDFTFFGPKSFAAMWARTGDERLNQRALHQEKAADQDKALRCVDDDLPRRQTAHDELFFASKLAFDIAHGALARPQRHAHEAAVHRAGLGLRDARIIVFIDDPDGLVVVHDPGREAGFTLVPRLQVVVGVGAGHFGDGHGVGIERVGGADVDDAVARHERKSLLRFIVCGSVDHGKSTLIGRLLYESGLVLSYQLQALSRNSATAGGQDKELDFSLLLDGLAAEREQKKVGCI